MDLPCMKYYLLCLLFVGSIVSAAMSAKGGRYYLEREGVREDKFYTMQHTAYIAGVNLSLACKCEVVIIQPSITLSAGEAVTGSIELTWDTPTQRVNGDVLLLEDIGHYIIGLYAGNTYQEYIVTGRSHVLELPTGTYEADISTVSEGVAGPKSSKIQFTL